LENAMKDWMNEDAYKTWTEAQKRLWESLSTNLPAFRPPQGAGFWQETYMRNLDAWETSVKQSLQVQAMWIHQWAQRMAVEQGTPEAMAAWTQQVEEVMQRWIQTQTQLWDNWFKMMKKGGNVAQKATQETAATTQLAMEEATSAAKELSDKVAKVAEEFSQRAVSTAEAPPAEAPQARPEAAGEPKKPAPRRKRAKKEE
jgi:hypothetical protein